MEFLEKTLDCLERLISFPSVSLTPNHPLIEDIARRLESIGARVEVLPSTDGSKANLFATIGPDVSDGIILSGHTDVVPVDGQEWNTDPFEVTEKDGVLYGRGTADMKSFAAIALALGKSSVETFRKAFLCPDLKACQTKCVATGSDYRIQGRQVFTNTT